MVFIVYNFQQIFEFLTFWVSATRFDGKYCMVFYWKLIQAFHQWKNF